MNKSFLITIDTEGDNLWGVSDIRQNILTENAKYLFRFQDLCEKFGFIPTYLTNYEMAKSEAMIELGRDGLKRNRLEIGAHEHAWNTPPYFPLIKRPIRRGKPYLGEYPRTIIARKLEYLTKLLEDTFQTEIKSHRGGRWCLNQTIVNELIKLDYIVDCTCTPGVDWSGNPGWTIGKRGTDWSDYEYQLFGLNEEKTIIEVPVTCVSKSKGKPAWLRPNGSNLEEMLGIVNYLDDNNCLYLEFMLHSSELMPGGSPTFKKKGQIERLYEDLEVLFEDIKSRGFQGIGITDFAKQSMKEGLVQ